MLLIIAIIAMVFFAVLGFMMPALALITSPIATVVLIFISVFVEQSEGAIVAPLIFLVTLIAILMSKRDPDSDQIPRKCAKWILISIGVLLIFVIACILFGPAGFIGFMFFILFIASIISYGFTTRRATTAYVISTIGASMRQNLPLAMALESAASGQTDNRSIILRRIEKWLVQGYSLSEAIRRGYPKCPSRAIAMITSAEKVGQLPLAFRAIETDMVAWADDSKKVKPFHPLYPIVVTFVVFLVALTLMQFVMPKFKMILEEMFEGAQLPVSTAIVLNVSSYIRYNMGPLLLIALVLIVLVGIPLWISIRTRPRRPQKPYLISRINDFIKWHLPVLRWLENNYSMVQMLGLLRLSLNGGCSVNGAIESTLGLDVNNCFRKRLQKWLKQIEQGENIAAAAKKSGLGSSLVWAFDEQVNQGNTLVILETLESFYRTNYSYRVNLIRYAMGPCVTIMLGAMVGFIIYAVFSPMVAIINHLANSVTP